MDENVFTLKKRIDKEKKNPIRVFAKWGEKNIKGDNSCYVVLGLELLIYFLLLWSGNRNYCRAYIVLLRDREREMMRMWDGVRQRARVRER